MQIQKIYSDYYDDERLYSILMSEDELTYLFSEEKKKKKPSLSRINSHRGLGRAILTSVPTGSGSLIGGYVAKNKADELDAKGLSDDEILIGAKSHGGKIGALTGAITGIGSAAVKHKSLPIAIASGLGMAGMGYVGGSQAAKVNTKARLRKRRAKMRGDEDEY